MNVGETILLTQRLSYADALGKFVTPTTPTAVVTAPDATISTPTVAAHAGLTVQQPYTLSLKLTPALGGPYKVVWQYVDPDGETIIQSSNRFAWWTSPADLIRTRLQKTAKQLSDVQLEPEIYSVAKVYLSQFPCIGNGLGTSAVMGVYNNLTGDDQNFFDEAAALAVCARLVGPINTGGQAADLTALDEGDVKKKFADVSKETVGLAKPGDLGGGPGGYSGSSERHRWLREAMTVLCRINVIQQQLYVSSMGFQSWTVSGPTRTAKAQGEIPTLMGEVIRLLSDDWIDSYYAGDTD